MFILYFITFTYRYLTHEELTSLRAPLMYVEHCTKPFFTKCDTDSNGMISLVEWGLCLGLTEGKLKAHFLILYRWFILMECAQTRYRTPRLLTDNTCTYMYNASWLLGTTWRAWIALLCKLKMRCIFSQLRWA